ncbi:MAG TPA: hypothetical protein V6C64_17165 [Microcoleaceae cyanobacterium]|jgi:hypothetical protein
MKVLIPLSCFYAALCAVLTGAIAAPALAQTQLDLNNDTPAFQGKPLQSGKIRVTVNYEPYNAKPRPDSEPFKNLQYRIFYNNQLQIEASDTTLYTGNVTLRDLDGDRSAEVIVNTFSGGAHCCTSFTIYSWKNSKFVKTETGFLDGNGGSFQDLDNNGKVEFITYDNAFLYAFSSYAGSSPPTKILALQQGQLRDVTRQYPKALRSRLNQMYEGFVERKRNGGFDLNGVLAGYVAQKILVGEYRQGWDFMLANYDRSSDWGLSILDRNGNTVGKYPDFPTALRAFLIQQKYLDAQGRPLK